MRDAGEHAADAAGRIDPSLSSLPLSLSLFVFVTGSCCFCVTPKALLFSFLLYSSYINGNVPSIIERTEYIETIGQQHISIN